jgi:hypothetical protein
MSVMIELRNNLLPAVIQALLVCIVRFFTIPWSIWKGAAFRLAAMRTAGAGQQLNVAASEFPVLEWFRNAWDGVIFLSWFAGIFLWFFSLFMDGNVASIITLPFTYFLVLLLSLFKESLILLLSIALNVEKLSAKTTAAQSE